MKKVLSIILTIFLMLSILPLGVFNFTASAATTWNTIPNDYYAYDILTYNGITTNAYYPKSSNMYLGKYDSDSTYSCAALPVRFYNNYGISIRIPVSGAPTVLDGSGTFSKVTSPQIGDILRKPNTHWAIVKNVSGNTITVFEQNYWWNNNGTFYAGKNRTITQTDINNGTWVIYRCSSFNPSSTHSHNYTIHEYEAAHPHKYYKKCSCGDSYYTGETAQHTSWSTITAATCTTTGTAKRSCNICDKTETKTIPATGHNYSIYEKEAAHPHQYYKKCSCGDAYYTGENATIDSCSQCFPVGKSIIKSDKSKYNIADTINFEWTTSERATEYMLWLAKKDTDGEYRFVSWNNSLTGNTFSISDLEIGQYMTYFVAYDTTRWNESHTDYSHTISEPIYFKIGASSRYYDWTFNFDEAMKLMSDVMLSDGSLSLALKEFNRGLIGSVDVFEDGNFEHLECTKRLGYKFIGWKTLLVPKQSAYDVSYNYYIFQAQYEPLKYSEGECIYGDINFDEEVNILDLVRLKKMLVGSSESHISADLDADNNINALDLSFLRKLLLGSSISKNVNFDANGGNVGETQRSVVLGQKLGELPIPTRSGFDFVGWYTNDGTEITSDFVIAPNMEITAIARWSAKSYEITWNTTTGCTITVNRTGSLNANASIGKLSSGDKIYYGDILSIIYTAKSGYTLNHNGKTSITVNANVTSSDIFATTTANSYTYNIVYKSSNGTILETATVKYKYGTTNTISPKSFSGYNTPTSQSVKWDSTTAKTITFTYTPSSVSTSQALSNGAWAIDGDTNFITYSVSAEYRNRTSNSIEVRVIWTNTLKANYYYQRGQVFNATIGGKSTGNVTIVPYDTWLYSSSSNRSLSGTSSWITVPVTATQTSISISADAYKQLSDGSLSNINESFSKTVKIPTY